MSDSILSFASSSSFRNKLIARNLAPYQVQGAYSAPSGNVTYEATPLGDSNVIDSPDVLISTNQGANQLYSLNEYGPDGGYGGKYSVPGAPYPVEPNQGPYEPNDTVLDLINEFYIDTAYIQNKFGPEGGYKDLVVITDVITSGKMYLPYWDPSIFVPSFYSPYEILSSTNPNGSNGSLSQDSYLAKIGATQLKGYFEDRIALEIQQMTIGSINLDTLSDPFSASLLATGQQPFFIKNWKITVPESPVFAAISFANRLTGTYFPVSFIPGDYFDENDPVGNVPSSLNTANNLTGGALGPILNKFRNPSEIFLANTGNGQQSVLFAALDYNIYRPQYQKNLIQGVSSAINNLFGGGSASVGGYYVGSVDSEPSQITTPANEVAVDRFGKQVGTIVYGPDELAKLYEGNEDKINFGLKAKSYTDGDGTDGKFVWTSPKYKDNAGFKVGPGGQNFQKDNEFNIIESQYGQNLSTDIEYKGGSILDNTQRIVQAADNVQGGKRLKHVGNAINQVSKVFNDGYKEMTKGSQVIAYYDQTTGDNTIGVSGFEVGREYCRVFQKDTPYLTYADLQKTDGITTSGRKFSYSIFDNTYNLNIAPIRNPGSTNIVDGKVKKYMFSLENLAWRTSSQPGFTYDDLPVCERGQNGGRIMWFPPYDITFSEDSKANWNPTSFLGRPEPIYTYKNTTRTGSLSWKIVVDSPAAMNTIVEKQLANRSPQEINSIMDSFFAGCVKYDLYDLASKFNKISPNKLYTYQQVLNKPNLTPEEYNAIISDVPVNKDESKGKPTGTETSQTEKKETETIKDATPANPVSLDLLNDYLDYGFYFENDSPYYNLNIKNPADPAEWKIQGPLGRPPAPQVDGSLFSYVDYYNYYISLQNTTYKDKAPAVVWASTGVTLDIGTTFNKTAIDPFFNDVVKYNFETLQSGFIKTLTEILVDKKGSVTIEMVGSASPIQDDVYNEYLSDRRINSVITWFSTLTFGEFKGQKYIDDGKLLITKTSLGENAIVTPKTKNGKFSPINCNINILNDGKNGKVVKTGGEWYSAPAMACRRVVITKIVATAIPEKEIVDVEQNVEKTTIINNPEQKNSEPIYVPPLKVIPTFDIEQSVKKGISKEVLRSLFSECDYFEVIKETNPMIFDSIKDKVKYFNPAFHSMTPEGLNARLTFLNQCMRPGQTIPVIGPDGKPKYNDALNTSFGAPPVLVLRIGDFYNTKIIPNSLGITFDPLLFDINPEGIGVQPMIAKVSLQFDFIGGHGIAGPVKELQNALSFNYYANTEIYDERSVATENTSEKDENLVKSIIKNGSVNNEPLMANQVDNQIPQKGGSTVGTILSTTTSSDGSFAEGEMDYKTLMNDLSVGTQTYFKTIFNQLKTLTSTTNGGIMSLASTDLEFNSGELNEYSSTPRKDVLIYGKSNSVEKYLKNLVNETKKDANDGNSPILIDIESLGGGKKYSQSLIRKLKSNMEKEVGKSENELNNIIIGTINEMTTYQEGYNYILRKLDVVCSGIDGVKIASGDYKVYNLSGETVINKIIEQYAYNVGDEVEKYFNVFLTDKILNKFKYDKKTNIFIPTDSTAIVTDYEKRFYMTMANIFLNDNKFNLFVESLLTNINQSENVELVNDIKKYSELFKVKCKKEYDAEIKIFDNLAKSQEYIEYETFKLLEFDSKLQYTTEKNGNNLQNMGRIKNLYSDVNINSTNKTYNGKVKFN
jgi:hypothetical protein